MKRTTTILSALVLLFTAGCVSTQSGGLPAPAPKAERLQAYLELARGHLSEGNSERAADPLERTIALDPNSTEAHVLMAVLSESRGEDALAERSYRTALRLDPKDPQALNNFGGFLLRTGRQEEALEHLRDAVKDPGYARREFAYENLGVAELSAGNRAAAKLAFARALGLDGDLPRANLELAALEFDDGNIPIANDFYERFRDGARQSPRSLCLGIRLARAMGDRDRLASFTLALKNLYPSSAEAQQCTAS